MDTGNGRAENTAANERSQEPQSNSSSRNYVSSGSSGLPAMEKLDGSLDYSDWKFQMELYLIHEDLWEYTYTTPDVTDVVGRKRDDKTKAKICLMIMPHCRVHVREAKTAKQAWDALKAAFEDKFSVL